MKTNDFEEWEDLWTPPVIEKILCLLLAKNANMIGRIRPD